MTDDREDWRKAASSYDRCREGERGAEGWLSFCDLGKPRDTTLTLPPCARSWLLSFA